MTLPRTFTRLLLVASLAAGGLVASSPPAQASFHLMMIREVSAGSDSGTTSDFVELQMYEPGQNFVAGKQVRIYDGNVEAASATFVGAVANGANQASILVSPDPALAADAMLSAEIPAEGGKACFVDPGTPDPPYGSTDQFIDCVAWGSQAGDADTGPPAPAIPPGQSVERTIARGCSTALDPPDDTNDSAADFQVATPSPRPNSAMPTETPCQPGGAPVLQGLKTKVKGNRATVTGTIQPLAPGEKVKLTFLANGSPLKKVAKKSATLNADSQFKKRFKVPSESTRCKVRVAFKGAKLGQKKFKC
ncbi:MAG: hypothetical protein ACRDKA_09390 [Actinomycetota bacterium]